MNYVETVKFPKNYYNVALSTKIFEDFYGVECDCYETIDIESFLMNSKEESLKLENGIISITNKEENNEDFANIIEYLDSLNVPYDYEVIKKVVSRPNGTKDLLQNNYKEPIDIDMDLVRKIANKNNDIFEKDDYSSSNCCVFDYFETGIHNPYVDETSRFYVNPIKYYGEENIRKFIKEYLDNIIECIHDKIDQIKKESTEMQITIIDKEVTVSGINIHDDCHISSPMVVCWSIIDFLILDCPFKEYKYKFFGIDSDGKKFSCFYNEKSTNIENI